MRRFLGPVLTLVVVCGAARGDDPAATARPNVLILVADDLGSADVAADGPDDVATPALDGLAAGGVRFAAGYVCAPVCSPSRAGLLTGRSPTRFGHEFNHPLADRAPAGLPATLVARMFADAGYATGHVGKWHLGNPHIEAFSPPGRGFTESVWFPGQKKLPPLAAVRDGRRETVHDAYVDDAIAREAADFVTRHRAGPWLLYAAFLTPHQPLDVPPGAAGSRTEALAGAGEERRRFAAMLERLDAGVGRVMEAVRSSGQEGRTLVVFVSDNGAPPRNGSRNTPCRGTKGTLWEGGVRVPFIIRWPGRLPAGRVETAPVSTLDLVPTALAAAGIGAPADTTFDGVDLLPYLAGDTPTPPHEALMWRYGAQRAIRRGDWKLTTALDATAAPPTVTTGLYDLVSDPGETRDRSAERPDLRRELESLWRAWDAENVPPLWGGEPASGDEVGDGPTARAAPAGMRPRP